MTSTTGEKGAILLLGGTGTVGTRIAPLLSSQNYTPILASQSGSSSSSYSTVKFDWTDSSTWSSALESHTSIKAVYIIASGMADPGPTAKQFIELALERGVKRFVLQSATSVPEGGYAMGKIHSTLREMGDAGRLEWGVIRPTWFQGSFYSLSLFSRHVLTWKQKTSSTKISGSNL